MAARSVRGCRFAIASSALVSMSQTKTRAPIAANARANSRPMPAAPAVIKTRCGIRPSLASRIFVSALAPPKHEKFSLSGRKISFVARTVKPHITANERQLSLLSQRRTDMSSIAACQDFHLRRAPLPASTDASAQPARRHFSAHFRSLRALAAAPPRERGRSLHRQARRARHRRPRTATKWVLQRRRVSAVPAAARVPANRRPANIG